MIEPFFVSLVASFSTIIPTMKSIRVALCFFLVFFPVVGSGCGYRLGGEGFSPAPEIRSIAIPTFVNQTYEAGIETVVTNALLAELIRDRRLQVVGEGEADATVDLLARLRKEVAKSEQTLDKQTVHLLEQWREIQEAYKGDEFVYKVRDREYRVQLQSESLSGQKIPEAIKDIEKRKISHTDVCRPGQMKDRIFDILGL